MPIYDLISESTGRSYRVKAARDLTDDEIARETERYDLQAQLAEQSKPFLDVTDLASSVGSAFGGLRKTLPASLQRMRVGLNRPDTYPEGAKKTFAEEKDFSDRIARENTYRLLTGDIGSVGESIREAGPSLGFSVASMGAAIPATLAGGAAGTAVGGPIGGMIGGTAAGMAASGAAAYRMAGAQFLDDAFNTYLQNNPGADEATKESVYRELLPLAQNSALWEAGPEAIGNAATLGAGKIFLGIGRKSLEKIARSALAKTGAVVGAQATELATETATQLGQGLPQAKAEAFNRGEDIATAKSPYTSDLEGATQAFKDVAPQTLALGGLMLGAGGVVKGGQRLFQPSPTIEGETMVPPAGTEPSATAAQEPEDDFGLAAFRQEMAEIAQNPDPIVPLQTAVNKTAEASVAVSADLLPATAAVIAAGGLKPAPAPRDNFEQHRARFRQGLSAEERADMEERLAQAEDEGVLADVFAEERRKAVQREDFLRRQRDLEDERQRLADQGILEDVFAEERQKAISRGQLTPTIEETTPPEQPIPAVEEDAAPYNMEQARRRWIDEERTRNPNFAPDVQSWLELQTPEDQDAYREFEELRYKNVAGQGPEKGYKPYKLSVKEKARLQELANKFLPRLAAEVTDITDAYWQAVSDAPKITSEEVPNVENVIDEPGEAEVGLGMEKTLKTVTLSNLFKLPESEVIEAANQVLRSREEGHDPTLFGKYKDDAKAKRFRAEPTKLHALDLVQDTLKAAASWRKRGVETSPIQIGVGDSPLAEFDKLDDIDKTFILKDLGFTLAQLGGGKENMRRAAASVAPEKLAAAIKDQKAISDTPPQTQPAAEKQAAETQGNELSLAPRDLAEERRKELRAAVEAAEAEPQEQLDPHPGLTFKEITDQRLPLIASRAKGKVKQLPKGYIRQGDLYIFQQETPQAEQPTPQRDTSKPEQMTPEEYGITESEPARYPPSNEKKRFGPLGFDSPSATPEAVARLKAEQKDYRDSQKRAKQRTEKSNSFWYLLEAAAKEKKPISAKAFKWRFGTSPPEGYVAEGELYVYRPDGGRVEEAPADNKKSAESASDNKNTPSVTKTQQTGDVSTLANLGEGWQIDGTVVSKSGFGHWTEKQRDEARTVFNKAGIRTNTSTPNGSGNRKSSFTIPSEDARRIQDEIFAEEVKLREAKKEQAKKAEADKQAEELSKVDPAALAWMTSLFGRDDFANPTNKMHLSDFVTGKTSKFAGMVNPRWIDGVQSAGAALEGGRVDFDALKKSFEAFQKTETKPAKPKVTTKLVTEEKAAELEEAEQPAPQRDTSKPEQMTPEEFEKDSGLFNAAFAPELADKGTQIHKRLIEEAAPEFNPYIRKPVSKAAVDAYGITLPEGYVAEGELYVYRPGGEVKAAPAPTSENLEEKKRTRLGKLLGDANRKEGSPSRIEMLDEARALWKTEKEYRYNGLIRLRDDITTLIQSSLGTDTINSKKIAEALIEGRPNLADKIASLAPVKQSEMTNSGAYPSTLTGFGYERGDRGVYTHPNAPSKEFGSINATISTPEGYQATRKRVAKKIGGQTNIGGMLDPVLLKDIIAIGAFYIEGGARSFASFSAKMIEDLGEGVRKYIQPAYDELRKRTDIDTMGMDPVEGGEPTILPEYESRRKQFQRNVQGPERLADVPDYIQTFLGEVFGVPSTRSSFAGANFDGQTPFSVQTNDRAEFTVGLGLNPQIQQAFETLAQDVFAELLLDTVTEEMIHLADFNALKEIWIAEGKSGDFNNWVASRSASTLAELQQAGFGDLVQSAWALYEDTNLANLSQKEIALLLSSNTFAAQGVVSEAARMAVQLRLKGDITETGWLKVKRVVNDGLADLLSGLKKALARSRDGGAKTLFQARIDSIEAEFSSFLNSREPTPKAEEPKTPPPPAPKAEAPKAEAPKAEAPKPAPTAAAETDSVGVAQALVKEQRENLGLDELMKLTEGAYTSPELWAASEAAVRADPTRGSILAKEVSESPRSLEDLDIAILLREEVVRTNALNLAMEEFNAAPKGNNEIQRDRMARATTALTEVHDALNFSGTKQGRAFNARKLIARLDYSLGKMITTLKAASDGSLKEGDMALIESYRKKIEKAHKDIDEMKAGEADRLAEAEKVAFEAGRQEVLKDIEDRAKAEAAKVAEMQKRKAEYLTAKKEAAKTPNKWEEIRAAARARKAELRSNLYSDVVLVKAASMALNDVIIGATYIAEGVTKFADWVSKMRSEDINLTDDEMQQLFKESKAFDAGEELPASEAPLKTRKTKAPAIDKVKAIAADEEQLDSRTVYNLVVEKMKKRAEESKAAKLPEMSPADLTSVISEVTEDVREFFPDITEREIRDLFSGYGKILMPSQDELSKQMRQLSALGKLQSAIEDAEAKRAPLKSGPQRDKATQAIRLQQKKLARELRMMGRDYEAGEDQLRSPLDAIKARLSNQIDDLAFEINTRKKIARRPATDYDPEAKALAELRDELKRISDFVNAPAGPTLEEMVKDEMDKLDTRINELQRLIAEGQLKPKEDTLLHTAELDAKRGVRDGLNRTLQKMRKEAADKLRTQEDIDKEAIKSLEESIAELKDKIKKADYTLPQRRNPTQTAAYKALVKEKEDLQKKVREEREKLFGRKGMSDEQRIKQATAAIDKSIERMQNMLTSGNYDVPKRTSKTPETPELAQKREDRKALRKRILELKKLKREAAIDPIAKQLKTDKKRIQTRIKKLKERMDKGDFSKPMKRQKATDDELLALQVEEENLKEEWAKLVFERHLASRGPGKRLLDAGQQTINTARALITSFDVSAVLRQGGFIVLGNPIRGFRNLGPMFKAFGDAEFAKKEKFRLQNRENFKNGAYQQSKLFLADVNKVDQMSKQEEAFMSRWIDKLPKGAKGLYIGSAIQGSQRAYTVFLNRLRADTFDAMVDNLKKGSEPTPQEMEAAANYINIATGRGDLGKFNQAGTMLNTVFFAPRLVVSRFQILAGYPYFTASGRTKSLILREYAKFFAGATVVYALGTLAQGDDDEPIETDPRSSDFLKIRFGDTRVDPLSGLIQATVLVSRLASGEKKQASGKIVPIRGEKVPYGADDSFDVMGNFVRTKFSPIVGSLVNVVTGKNVVGETTDAVEETKRMLIPMSFTEMKETFEAQGIPEATALTMLQLFGVGIQTYTQGKK